MASRMKVKILSLLISILIHLGLLAAPFSLSPPKSAKYVKSIKVDYIISLPKINHQLRKSRKTIVSPLTLASRRENEKSLDKASILSSFSPLTRVDKSPLMRKIGGRVYLAREENLSQKRWVDHTPSSATEPVGLNQTLPLRQRKKSPAFLGPPFEEKKSEPMPCPYSPNLLLSKISLPRVKAGLDLLNLDEKMPLSSIFRCLLEESKIEIERINYTPGCSAGSAKSRDSGAWISQRKYERKYRPRIISSSLAMIFPPERNLDSFPMRQRKFLLLPTKKNHYPGQILSSSLDPTMQPRMGGYSPILEKKKFSPLTTEPDSHQEEIRILKEDTELLTESLRLREYAEKIRKLIKANKKYPSVARQHGWEGRIKVRFMINSSGEVIKTEVLSPCSHEVLNYAAEKLIKDTSPFPPFPSPWHKNSLTVELQIVYQLEESTLTKEDRD